MAQSNADYGKQEGTPVDLGATFGKEPTIPGATEGKDIADATSQSPQSQSRGGADPVNIGPGSVQTDFDAIPADSYAAVDDDKGSAAAYDTSSQGDAVNDHAFSLGNPRYEPKY
jgi:hypothetical protein